MTIQNDLKASEYHSMKLLSKSALDLIDQSPAHFKAYYLDGLERSVTPSMQMGSWIHMAVLEPSRFQSEVKVLPEDLNALSKATKAFKEGFANLIESNPGVTFIDSDKMAIITGARDSVMSHKQASQLLTGGQSEVSMFFEIDGIKCKARPDYIHAKNIMSDLKTTTSGGRQDFERTIMRSRLHVQAAWYMDGWEKITGQKFRRNSAGDPAFMFVVVETSPPYATAVYQLADAAVEKGRELYMKNLQVYQWCMKNNSFPSYGEMIGPEFEAGIQVIGLPPWGYTQ